MSGTVLAKGNVFGKFIFTILGSIGLAIIYGVRDNYSLLYEAAYDDDNVQLRSDQFILIFTFYMLGSLLSALPAAFVVYKFSAAKWVMFFGVAINIVCTLLTPSAMYLGYIPFILLRVIEGIGLGATIPALHCMIAAWSPPNQRTVISTIIYASLLYAGHVADFFSKLLQTKLELQMIYYIFGGLSCIWLILWLIIVQDKPNKQSLISQREHEMITATLHSSTGERSAFSFALVPWGRILTSQPFWAIVITHGLYTCGMYIFNVALVIQLFNSNFSYKSQNLTAWILSIILCITLDLLRAKQKISTTVARKIATGISTAIPGICILLLCFLAEDSLPARIFLAIGGVSIDCCFSGFLFNHIDIAPNYAGILGAITNTVATIPLIVLPFIAYAVDMADIESTAWLVSMAVAVACFIAGFFAFVIFGSGEEQPWNKISKLYDIRAEIINTTSLNSEWSRQEFGNINF